MRLLDAHRQVHRHPALYWRRPIGRWLTSSGSVLGPRRGLTPSNRGRIALEGWELTGLPTHGIIAAGISCIPEGRRVFPNFTAEENLRVGAHQEPSEAVVAERLAQQFRPWAASHRGWFALRLGAL